MNDKVILADVKRFREAFTRGVDGLVEASQIYVRAIDDNPNNADLFREQMGDWIPASAWAGFEAVGRKWMHPRLLMGGLSDRKKNSVVKTLPYSLQERVFARERFELLVSGGNKVLIDVLEAPAEQVEQVFAKDHVRTLGEQRAWLESAKVHQEVTPEPLPYSVRDGKLIVRRAVTLTKNDLRRLLQEM